MTDAGQHILKGNVHLGNKKEQQQKRRRQNL
jgi:hypothetical protein